eukprot:6758268-Prorocentrum_lima.AAC.1
MSKYLLWGRCSTGWCATWCQAGQGYTLVGSDPLAVAEFAISSGSVLSPSEISMDGRICASVSRCKACHCPGVSVGCGRPPVVPSVRPFPVLLRAILRQSVLGLVCHFP